MALSTTHTDYTKGSYKKDRNDLIKSREYKPLYASIGKPPVDLDAIDDGDDSMAMGYGYDLFQNVESIKSTLKKFVVRKDGDTTKTVDAALTVKRFYKYVPLPYFYISSYIKVSPQLHPMWE